jgi:Uma2 family endonuclease
MSEIGVLGPDERVELINGRLFRKLPANPPHMYSGTRLRKLCYTLVPAGWTVFDADSPFEIPRSLRKDGMPLPDAFIARGDIARYATRRPDHHDVVLVVEVSDSTLDYDCGEKLELYAIVGIPEYWIVNLIDRRIEVYTQPTGPDRQPTYRHRDDYPSGRSVPLALDGLAIAMIVVDDLLPPPAQGGGGA